MSTPNEILDFWFTETNPARWFKPTDAFDANLRARFETAALMLAGEMRSNKPHKWEVKPNYALALIIVLDQFPRHMYRGTKGAYAWDNLALDVVKRLCENNRDLKIEQSRRNFIYMPFMHSENLDDQNRCIKLVDSRLDDASTLHHAKEHARLIERFGRFPHRNKILGRQSTAEEIAFLNSGGYAP